MRQRREANTHVVGEWCPPTLMSPLISGSDIYLKLVFADVVS